MMKSILTEVKTVPFCFPKLLLSIPNFDKSFDVTTYVSGKSIGREVMKDR